MTPRIPAQPPRGNIDLANLILPGIQDVVDDAPIIGDMFEIFTGREDGNLNDFGSIWNGLFGRVVSLASKVKAIESKIAIDALFYDDLNRGDSDVLGNGWVQGGEGQPLGIRDQAAQIIRGGVIAQTGRRWALAPVSQSSDRFSVAMVTHPIQPSAIAQTSLLARCNDVCTEGLSLNMFRGKCYLAKFTRSGNSWTFTDIASNLQRSYSSSAIVEWYGEADRLVVVIDGVTVIDTTDTTHVQDAAHRRVGFSETTVQPFLALPEYSTGLATFSLRGSGDDLPAVEATATAAATAAVTPVASAVTAGASGAAQPVDADPEVYAAQKKLADDAAAAAQAATNAQIQLQQQQQNDNTSGGGVKKLFQFSSGPLNSTDWTSNTGAFVQSNGQLTLSGNVAVNTFWIARPNYTFNTDDQAISVLLGDNANNDQPTFLVLRASADGTTGVACRITANSVQVGTIAFGGDGSSSPGFTAAIGVSPTLGSGDSIEFRAVGNQFSVFKNGGSILGYTGSLGTTGSTRRSAAVIMNKAQPFLVYYSFNLRSFGMNDYGTTGQAVSSRTSARLSRTGTGEVSMSVGSGSYAVVPSNFFGSIDFAQGMTVTDLAAGKIRIDTPGWYQVTAAFQSRYTGEGSYYGAPFWCLILNGAQASPGIPGGVSLPVALAAGDVIQAGVTNYQGTVTKRSTGDGSYSASGPATLDVIGGNAAFFQAVFDI